MKVSNLTPKANIAAYVEKILVIEAHQITSPFSLPLFANGTPTLVFNSVRGTISKDPTGNLTLFGQTILPETLTFTEGFTLIAYFFKPYVLGPLFGVTALELTDKPINLHLLMPKKTTRLQEQLLNAGSTATQIALLDRYIAGLTTISNNDCPKIRYAAIKNCHQYFSRRFIFGVKRSLYHATNLSTKL